MNKDGFVGVWKNKFEEENDRTRKNLKNSSQDPKREEPPQITGMIRFKNETKKKKDCHGSKKKD